MAKTLSRFYFLKKDEHKEKEGTEKVFFDFKL